MGQSILLRRPDGREIAAYLALPRGEAHASVVVLHEWWGLTDVIRGVADRLAEAGYRAVAPDLYGGFLATTPIEGMRRLRSFDFVDAAEQDVRAALLHEKASCPRAAVLGFSLGGAVALVTAVRAPECDAVVCFYGIPSEEHVDLRQARVPLQVHLCRTDDFFRPRQVARFDAQLKEARPPVNTYWYDARHGFLNTDASEVFDAAAAEAAWARTQAFLAAHLT